LPGSDCHSVRDRPQLQVAIDATIAEVTLNNSLSYGVQSAVAANMRLVA
jgi:type II secretory pathway component GspD/PulD (secretin)